jgi:hypothetical protein
MTLLQVATHATQLNFVWQFIATSCTFCVQACACKRKFYMSSTLSRRKLVLVAIPLSLSLAGCYVIPLDHQGRPSNVAYAPVPTPYPIAPPAPSQINLVARLYPANDAAASTGVLIGQVVNNLNGRGTFNVNAGGESFSGEATRSGQGANQGNANAAGSRGGYVRCSYTMNTSSQGSGECTFSSGGRYTMHLSG